MPDDRCYPIAFLSKSFILFLVAGGISVAAPAGTDGAEYESLANITRIAKDFISARLEGPANTFEVRTGRLDARLRLSQCHQPLEAFLPPGSRTAGNTSIGVRCHGRKPWTVYVPVQIRRFATAVVAARPIPRGQMITRSDLLRQRIDVTSLPATYASEPAQLINMVAKRSIPAGHTIALNAVTRPLLVRRGESVVIISGNDHFEVKMKGIALGNGTAGERIRVKNMSSKRIIYAEVREPGVVYVAM